MAEALTVIYDGECSLCQNATEFLKKLDKDKRLVLVPLQDPWVLETFPDIPPYRFRQVMHVLNAEGNVYTGAAGYREIGRNIYPYSLGGLLLRLYAYLVMLPGMLFLAEWVYSQIANNRYRWFPRVKL